jgi:hypothetical protein
MKGKDPRRTLVAVLAIAGFFVITLAGGVGIYAVVAGSRPAGEVEKPAAPEEPAKTASNEKKEDDCVPQRPKAVRGQGPQWFTDITEASGIDFQHVVGPLGTYFMPESIGAGGALFDYDGDGDLDLLLVNSGRSPKASGDFPAGTRIEDRLFRQDADGAFVDVTSASGLGELGYSVGCAVGDIDDDGCLDVYVTNYGPDRLFHNNGDGTFSDVSELWGIDVPEWGTCAVFFDYDRDKNLDLFVVNYTHDPLHGHAIACGITEARVSYCGPLKFQPTVDRLFHNEGFLGHDGQMGAPLADVTKASGIEAETTYGFGVLAGDFSGDGWPDLYVANDAKPKRLWINQRDGTFRDEGRSRGAAFNMAGRPEGSMGLSMGDIDGDGHFDFVASNLSTEGASIFLGDSDGLFVEASERLGLRRPTLPHTGWGMALVDLDHDGDLDLPMVNGLVIPCNSGFAPHGEEVFYTRNERIDDPAAYWRTYADPNLLFLNEGGKFLERSSSGGDFCAAVGSGRGMLYGDLDDDGDLDLVVTNCGEKAKIYRNDMPKSGSWLKVRAIDPTGQRNAYGALVTVIAGGRRFQRFINPADSYLASNDPRLHFGLGGAETYDSIEVRWPDGETEQFAGGAANQLVTVVRGEGSPE